MSTTLTPQEVRLFALLTEKGGQFEMKEWSAINPKYADKLRELEKRGFIRFADAFLLPFKVPTGTQFCILTDAGKMAYESQLVEVKIPFQGTCNHAFLRPDKSCVHCGAPMPEPKKESPSSVKPEEEYGEYVDSDDCGQTIKPKPRW